MHIILRLVVDPQRVPPALSIVEYGIGASSHSK